MNYDFSSLKKAIADKEDWLKRELSLIRTGRATLSILDAVNVEVYGARMAINQVAGVSIEDPKTIRITPWDSSQIKAIEKGVLDCDLGLSVVTDDRGLRVIFPELTGERREALAKLVKQKHEEARVSIRMERDKVKGEIEESEKKGGMGEDEKFRFLEEMQKLIDSCNKNLDDLAERKEKEVLN